MKIRHQHILIVSFVLIGPVLTTLFWTWDIFKFTSCLFPITIDSLYFNSDPKTYHEWNVVRWILPLFFLKVLVLGVISLVRLLNKTNDRLLSRFYTLVLVICLVKIFAVLFDISGGGNVNLIALLLWSIVLGIMIKRSSARQTYS